MARPTAPHRDAPRLDAPQPDARRPDAPSAEAHPGQKGPRRRLLVILNPTAGRRHRGRCRATLERLRALGCAVTLRETTAAGEASALARAADPAAFDGVVAAGGDGTVNEVINGLIGIPLPLALLPLGTANVLAAEIGLGLAPETVARAIVEGPRRRIACGRAGDRYFTQMAGVGFDAQVVENVDLALKRRIGKGAYVLEALRQAVRFGFPTYRVTADGESFTAASVIVAKGKHYAGRYLLAPEAAIEDPVFQVCLFERGGPLAVVRYALALQTGRLPARPDLRRLPARHITIEGPAGDPVQGDGDTIGRLPIEIAIVPDAIDLIFAAG
ncbi:MAG: YegS/Rv2252/BmrU family lipid kinase [Kiloniellales bacterium]|nr:YegS/Rv2252/BmrU family lipid kinase [Kiloniellales bacterium]